MSTFSLDTGAIAHKGKGSRLLTVAEAAEAFGVSDRHIKRLIHEADCNRKSRWRWGRELIDLSPVGSQRRTVRINIQAIVPEL
jgi:hypothetical protein